MALITLVAQGSQRTCVTGWPQAPVISASGFSRSGEHQAQVASKGVVVRGVPDLRCGVYEEGVMALVRAISMPMNSLDQKPQWCAFGGLCVGLEVSGDRSPLVDALCIVRSVYQNVCPVPVCGRATRGTSKAPQPVFRVLRTETPTIGFNKQSLQSCEPCVS